MKNRDEIRDQFSPLLDGELPPDEREAIESALSQDADLLRELDTLKRVDDLYRDLPPVAAPQGFDEALRERLHPKMVAVAAAAAVAPLYRKPRRIWPALAAAAVVLVGIAFAFVRFQSGQTMKVASVSEPNLKSDMSLAAPEYKKDVDSDARAAGGAAAASPAPAQQQAPVAQSSMPAADASKLPELNVNGAAGGAFGAPAQTRGANETPNDYELYAKEKAPQPAKARQKEVENNIEQDRLSGTSAGSKILPTPPATPMPAGSRDENRPAMHEEFDGAKTGRMDAGDVAAKPAPADKDINLRFFDQTAPASPSAAAAPATPPPAPSAPPKSEPESVSAGATADKKETSQSVSRTMSKESLAEKQLDSPRTFGDRTFTLRGGVWYENGYTDQKFTTLDRKSKTAQDLFKKRSDLADVTALKEPIVVKIDTRWYKISAAPK